MFKRYTFWLKTAIVFQLLTAAIHSLSLFVTPVPQNETERQLLDLMTNYRQDAGAGFTPSAADLMKALSSCFSLVCLLGGLTNAYLLKKNVSVEILRGMTGIQLLVFGICFAMMAFFTFLPPIVLTGLIFVSLVATFFILPKNTAIT
ncbi:MAG TPA: hypothetical protein VII11_02945 [Bacteroidota bacterium]